jgi:hypothetical protein
MRKFMFTCLGCGVALWFAAKPRADDIPTEMRSARRAVNITAGLPIVRTSVAHGTAYDIAGKGVADASSLVAAARVAAKLASISCPTPDSSRRL